MATTIEDFQALCQTHWGRERRSWEGGIPGGPLIPEFVEFGDATPELRVHLADHLIRESSRTRGSFTGFPSKTAWFLQNAIQDIPHLHPVLGERRYEPLQLALWLSLSATFSSGVPAPSVIDLNHLLRGGGAVAALYLLGTLEQLFRRRCRYVNQAGKVIGDKDRLRALLPGAHVGNRLNRLDLTFRAWVYDANPEPLARRLRDLDAIGVLHPRLSDRLANDRHPAMHGEWADPSSEARFLALLVGMFVYDEGGRTGPHEQDE